MITQGHGDERDGQQSPDDAGDDRAGGQAEQDHQRVQGHRPPEHERGEDVALELVDHDHHRGHDQCGNRPVGDEGDQCGQGAGDGGAGEGM